MGTLCQGLTESGVLFVCVGEGRSEVKKLTFCQLREEVARYRAAMRAMGVQANDRVVGQCLTPHLQVYR